MPSAPRLRAVAEHSAPSVTDGALGGGIVFALSVYLTYFGSGVGNMFTSLFLVRGFGDFFNANAAKNIVLALGTVMATVAYGVAGLIGWLELLPVFIGSAAGGAAFAKVARRIPPVVLRGSIIALGLTVAAYQFVF